MKKIILTITLLAATFTLNVQAANNNSASESSKKPVILATISGKGVCTATDKKQASQRATVSMIPAGNGSRFFVIENEFFIIRGAAIQVEDKKSDRVTYYMDFGTTGSIVLDIKQESGQPKPKGTLLIEASGSGVENRNRIEQLNEDLQAIHAIKEQENQPQTDEKIAEQQKQLPASSKKGADGDQAGIAQKVDNGPRPAIAPQPEKSAQTEARHVKKTAESESSKADNDKSDKHTIYRYNCIKTE